MAAEYEEGSPLLLTPITMDYIVVALFILCVSDKLSHHTQSLGLGIWIVLACALGVTGVTQHWFHFALWTALTTAVRCDIHFGSMAACWATTAMVYWCMFFSSPALYHAVGKDRSRFFWASLGLSAIGGLSFMFGKVPMKDLVRKAFGQKDGYKTFWKVYQTMCTALGYTNFDAEDKAIVLEAGMRSLPGEVLGKAVGPLLERVESMVHFAGSKQECWTKVKEQIVKTRKVPLDFLIKYFGTIKELGAVFEEFLDGIPSAEASEESEVSSESSDSETEGDGEESAEQALMERLRNEYDTLQSQILANITDAAETDEDMVARLREVKAQVEPLCRKYGVPLTDGAKTSRKKKPSAAAAAAAPAPKKHVHTRMTLAEIAEIELKSPGGKLVPLGPISIDDYPGYDTACSCIPAGVADFSQVHASVEADIANVAGQIGFFVDGLNFPGMLFFTLNGPLVTDNAESAITVLGTTKAISDRYQGPELFEDADRSIEMGCARAPRKIEDMTADMLPLGASGHVGWSGQLMSNGAVRVAPMQYFDSADVASLSMAVPIKRDERGFRVALVTTAPSPIYDGKYTRHENVQATPKGLVAIVTVGVDGKITTHKRLATHLDNTVARDVAAAFGTVYMDASMGGVIASNSSPYGNLVAKLLMVEALYCPGGGFVMQTIKAMRDLNDAEYVQTLAMLGNAGQQIFACMASPSNAPANFDDMFGSLEKLWESVQGVDFNYLDMARSTGFEGLASFGTMKPQRCDSACEHSYLPMCLCATPDCPNKFHAACAGNFTECLACQQEARAKGGKKRNEKSKLIDCVIPKLEERFKSLRALLGEIQESPALRFTVSGSVHEITVGRNTKGAKSYLSKTALEAVEVCLLLSQNEKWTLDGVGDDIFNPFADKVSACKVLWQASVETKYSACLAAAAEVPPLPMAPLPIAAVPIAPTVDDDWTVTEEVSSPAVSSPATAETAARQREELAKLLEASKAQAAAAASPKRKADAMEEEEDAPPPVTPTTEDKRARMDDDDEEAARAERLAASPQGRGAFAKTPPSGGGGDKMECSNGP